MLAGGIKDCPALYREAYKHVKPGGWIEPQEHEIGVDTDEKAVEVKKWFGLLNEASLKFGKKVNVAHEQKQFMIDVGFVDVKDDIYKVFASDIFHPEPASLLLFGQRGLCLVPLIGSPWSLAKRSQTERNRHVFPHSNP